jgi:hypothetical protein
MSISSAAATHPVLATGWSPENRFHQGSDTYIHNSLIAMREGHANAISFRDKTKIKNGESKARFVLITLEDKQQAYYVYAHNGIPFDSINQILDKGCKPNESARTGYSLNGCGLGYLASTLDQELLVASSTLDDNKWKVGRAFMNQEEKLVEISRAIDIEDNLVHIFGTEFLNEFTVIYMWKIKYFEKAGKKESWSIHDSTLNSLSFMCGNDWFNKVQLKVSTQICRLHGKEKLGKNVSFWLNHKEDKDTGDITKGKHDHKHRIVPSIDELILRNSADIVYPDGTVMLGKWGVKTDDFVIKSKNTEDTVRAVVEIIAFSGEMNVNLNGSYKDGFLLAQRDAPEDYSIQYNTSWKQGSSSAEGARPSMSGFLYFPLFYDGNKTDAFARFLDNAMHTDQKVKQFLEQMDIYYEDKQESVNLVRKSYRPYAIVRIAITDLLIRIDKAQNEIYENPSKNLFMDAIDRNPIFLSGLSDSSLGAIMKAACLAAGPKFKEQHPDCLDWFKNNFKPPIVDCLPISTPSGGKAKGEPKKKSYKVYDLDVNDFEFDEELYTRTTRYLVFQDVKTGRFVNDVRNTKIPRSEGFKITPMTPDDLSFTDSGDERKERYEEFKIDHGIADDITVFEVKTCPLGLKGKKPFKGKLAEAQQDYADSYNSADAPLLIPTRGFHINTEYGVIERCAVVADVPPRKTKGRPPKSKPEDHGSETGPAGGTSSTKQRFNYHCERDARIPIELGKGNTVRLNKNYKLFSDTLFAGLIASPATTIKWGQEIYDTVSHIASGIAQAIAKVSLDCKIERQDDKWNDADGKGIWTDDTDYLVNQSLVNILDLLPNIQDLKEKFDSAKSRLPSP